MWTRNQAVTNAYIKYIETFENEFELALDSAEEGASDKLSEFMSSGKELISVFQTLHNSKKFSNYTERLVIIFHKYSGLFEKIIADNKLQELIVIGDALPGLQEKIIHLFYDISYFKSVIRSIEDINSLLDSFEKKHKALIKDVYANGLGDYDIFSHLMTQKHAGKSVLARAARFLAKPHYLRKIEDMLLHHPDLFEKIIDNRLDLEEFIADSPLFSFEVGKLKAMLSKINILSLFPSSGILMIFLRTISTYNNSRELVNKVQAVIDVALETLKESNALSVDVITQLAKHMPANACSLFKFLMKHPDRFKEQFSWLDDLQRILEVLPDIKKDLVDFLLNNSDVFEVIIKDSDDLIDSTKIFGDSAELFLLKILKEPSQFDRIFKIPSDLYWVLQEFPKYSFIFKDDLSEVKQVILKMVKSDIKKNARLLAQGLRDGNCFFSVLPKEILLHIADLTDSPQVLSKEERKEIIEANFAKP